MRLYPFRSVLWCIVLLSLALVSKVSAQAALPLTEFYTNAEGTIVFNYPAEWEIIPNPEPELNASLVSFSFNAEGSALQNGMTVLMSSIGADYLWRQGAMTPVELLLASRMLGGRTVHSQPQKLTIGERTAAIMDFGRQNEYDAFSLMVQLSPTAVVWFRVTVPYGEREQYRPTVLAMAESFIASSTPPPAKPIQLPDDETQNFTSAFGDLQFSIPLNWTAGDVNVLNTPRSSGVNSAVTCDLNNLCAYVFSGNRDALRQLTSADYGEDAIGVLQEVTAYRTGVTFTYEGAQTRTLDDGMLTYTRYTDANGMNGLAALIERADGTLVVMDARVLVGTTEPYEDALFAILASVE